MSPQIARKAIDYFRRKEQDEAAGALTPREREIVEAITKSLRGEI
jgi:DNA-binding NarL/FixJ family response regulator